MKPAHPARPKVALVYPPFGPSGLPSLGLGLLAASLRTARYEVRVDYWNLAVLTALPYPDVARRSAAFQRLSSGSLFPWNERAYRHAAYGDDPDILTDLTEAPLSPEDRALIFALRMQADADVAAAVGRLAGADIVGIASTFHQIAPAVALARAIKARNPAAITVLGGANADDPMAQAHLRLHPMFDFVVAGEADTSFPALIDALAEGRMPDNIPGVCCRDASGLPMPMVRPVPVQKMDDLPIPDFTDYVTQWAAAGLNQINRLSIALESSRGCWWGEHSHCVFCGLNGNGMGFRQKSFDRFIAEVEVVVERHGAPFLFMADNILSMSYYEPFRKWSESRGLSVDFFYEIKANLRRDQVEQLGASGVTVVQPGIESFSTPVLKLMRKGLRGIQNIAFLKYAADAGLRPVYNILTGFPGETANDTQAMIDAMPQLFHLFPPTSAPIVEFHRFSPYHNRPQDFGLTLQPDPRYSQIFPFSQDDIAEIAYRFVDPDRRLDPGLSRLPDVLALWQQRYWRDAARMTHAVDAQGDLWIDDRRDPAHPRRSLLLGLAADIHAALDRPHTPSSLKRQIENAPGLRRPLGIGTYFTALAEHPDAQVIWIDGSQFYQDPAACVDLLHGAGLTYREEASPGEPLYLALATRPQPARAVPDLERLGI
jgi:ribosomal peptide maturation radical SAM protein 1